MAWQRQEPEAGCLETSLYRRTQAGAMRGGRLWDDYLVQEMCRTQHVEHWRTIAEEMQTMSEEKCNDINM